MASPCTPTPSSTRPTGRAWRGSAATAPAGLSPQTVEAVRQGLHDVVHSPHGTAHSSGLLEFGAAGIGLEYKVYDYPEYPQLWGEYTHGVTILDLLFNCGSESPHYMKFVRR